MTRLRASLGIALLICGQVWAGWQGFPLSTNKTWYAAETNHPVEQILGAIDERYRVTWAAGGATNTGPQLVSNVHVPAGTTNEVLLWVPNWGWLEYDEFWEGFATYSVTNEIPVAYTAAVTNVFGQIEVATPAGTTNAVIPVTDDHLDDLWDSINWLMPRFYWFGDSISNYLADTDNRITTRSHYEVDWINVGMRLQPLTYNLIFDDLAEHGFAWTNWYEVTGSLGNQYVQDGYYSETTDGLFDVNTNRWIAGESYAPLMVSEIPLTHRLAEIRHGITNWTIHQATVPIDIVPDYYLATTNAFAGLQAVHYGSTNDLSGTVTITGMVARATYHTNTNATRNYRNEPIPLGDLYTGYETIPATENLAIGAESTNIWTSAVVTGIDAAGEWGDVVLLEWQTPAIRSGRLYAEEMDRMQRVLSAMIWTDRIATNETTDFVQESWSAGWLVGQNYPDGYWRAYPHWSIAYDPSQHWNAPTNSYAQSQALVEAQGYSVSTGTLSFTWSDMYARRRVESFAERRYWVRSSAYWTGTTNAYDVFLTQGVYASRWSADLQIDPGHLAIGGDWYLIGHSIAEYNRNTGEQYTGDDWHIEGDAIGPNQSVVLQTGSIADEININIGAGADTATLPESWPEMEDEPNPSGWDYPMQGGVVLQRWHISGLWLLFEWDFEYRQFTARP